MSILDELAKTMTNPNHQFNPKVENRVLQQQLPQQQVVNPFFTNIGQMMRGKVTPYNLFNSDEYTNWQMKGQ